MSTIILASTSVYRRELLQRLGLPFEVISPGVDEGRQPDETADALALRLSVEKARAVAHRHADAIVIGADQVAAMNGTILGKPGSPGRNIDQLLAMSGREVTFHTAVTVVRAATDEALSRSVEVRAHLRNLSEEAIARYVARESAVDAAGGFKVEGLGIALFERVQSDDPTALVGLPLIALVDLLAELGIDPLDGGHV
ncbi:MAG: nucleoside triphosphate pyrophosphatase [Pseudomonadota bacterium]